MAARSTCNTLKISEWLFLHKLQRLSPHRRVPAGSKLSQLDLVDKVTKWSNHYLAMHCTGQCLQGLPGDERHPAWPIETQILQIFVSLRQKGRHSTD